MISTFNGKIVFVRKVIKTKLSSLSHDQRTWIIEMIKKALVGVVLSQFLFTLNLVWAGDWEDKWDMPLAYSASNYHTEIAAEFAATITEATGGKLLIATYPNGTLYKGDEIYEAVQSGKAPIGERLISALGPEHPVFEIDVLPFLVSDFSDAKKLYLTTKPVLEEVLERSGVKLLYTVPWPPQGLYTMKPVNSISEMKGIKFRAYNVATSRLAEKLGAVPTKIEAKFLSKAFETGKTESMISSSATGYDRKLWSYVSHWYDVSAWVPKNMVFVNLAAWNQLDADYQSIILEAAATAEATGWTTAEELSDWYESKLIENGMKVIPPSDNLNTEFMAIGDDIMKEWWSRADELDRATIKAYQSK